jgi:hypothetical protein
VSEIRIPFDLNKIYMVKHRTCACCDEQIPDKHQVYTGEPKTHYEGKTLCESCFYDSDPIATIFYGRDTEPRHITMARNETRGDYKADWHSTDPWRGYYQLSSDKYTRIFSDAILSYHESEAMLKELDDKAMSEFDSRNIEYTRAFLRTSNVFSTGYDIWVRKQPEQIFIAHFTIQKIKKEVNFDNPLYSTGILMGREEFGKLQRLLKGKYELEIDRDLMKLMNERGGELLDEIQKLYQEGGAHGD